MRAMQWTTTTGGIENTLKLNPNAPLPKRATSLPKDSALVKVAFSTINPVDHKLPEAPILSSLLFTKPAIPCRDYAGTVVETTLPHLKPGDLVFAALPTPAFGGLGEYVVVTGKDDVVKAPDGVSLEDAVALGVAGLTAYQCIAPNVKEGGKVFINGGSGGTGTFGIQIAKAMGCRVTTTCSTKNIDFCKDLGADEVIDYRTTNVVEHLKRQGTQYDVLIDNVNILDIYWNAHHYLKPEGKFITIAGSFTLSSMISMSKMLMLPTWLGGGKRKAAFVLVKNNAEQYAQIAEMMKEGKVRTVVEKRFELEEAAEAFASLKTGRTRGKLIVKVARD